MGVCSYRMACSWLLLVGAEPFFVLNVVNQYLLDGGLNARSLALSTLFIKLCCSEPTEGFRGSNSSVCVLCPSQPINPLLRSLSSEPNEETYLGCVSVLWELSLVYLWRISSAPLLFSVNKSVLETKGAWLLSWGVTREWASALLRFPVVKLDFAE